MQPIDLIIFDLDGTLVDSIEDIANAVNFTLKEVGLEEKSIQEISSYVGTGTEDLIRKSLGKNEDTLFEKALSLFKEYYKKHPVDNSRLYPGAREILEYFKDKRKVIVTNRMHEFALKIIKVLNIYDYFEDILGGDDLGCAKPSSCLLDKAMNQLNIDKERTIIVGDMDVDIFAGKKAGIHTCAVTYGIGLKEDILRARPDYMIDNILRLKEIIT